MSKLNCRIGRVWPKPPESRSWTSDDDPYHHVKHGKLTYHIKKWPENPLFTNKEFFNPKNK